MRIETITTSSVYWKCFKFEKGRKFTSKNFFDVDWKIFKRKIFGISFIIIIKIIIYGLGPIDKQITPKSNKQKIAEINLKKL